MSRVFDSIRCPHGKRKVEEGYTRRAKGFYTWQEKKKEKYKEVLNAVNIENRKLAFCGDYIYLPYSYMNTYVNKLTFIENSFFIKKEGFTIENIVKIINFKPQAMMGGTIAQYEKEEVTKFLHHLREEYPSKFGELMKEHSSLVEKHLGKEINFVGRKALVKTLKQGCVVVEGNQEYLWNGEKLICEDYRSSFLPFRLSKGYLEVTPNDETVVEITNNNQVDENTKFIE